MSEMKHTPGPWDYFPATNYGGFAIAPRGILPTLAGVERCGHNVHIMCHNFPGSTEANARLIAAAPELLAALQRVLTELDVQVREPGLMSRNTQELSHGTVLQIWKAVEMVS